MMRGGAWPTSVAAEGKSWSTGVTEEEFGCRRCSGLLKFRSKKELKMKREKSFWE